MHVKLSGSLIRVCAENTLEKREMKEQGEKYKENQGK